MAYRARTKSAESEFPQHATCKKAGWAREFVVPPSQLWVGYYCPIKPCRFELGTLALIQYNKLSRCLLLNRPETFFRHVLPCGKQDAAVRAVYV